MKYLFSIALIFTLASCKQCVECKYATLKGSESEKFCSSTKQDRIDFENKMDSLAKAEGSTAFCSKTGF